MSNLPPADGAIAIVLGDLHLSHTPPIARSAHAGAWYEYQAQYLSQIHDLMTNLDVSIVVCTGDIFDVSDPPAELINFAIRHLPHGMYSVPGNHEIPNHNLDDLHKSAYYTLISCGTIKPLNEDFRIRQVELRDQRYLNIYGFGYGEELMNRDAIRRKCDEEDPLEDDVNLLVAHKYVWHRKIQHAISPEGGNLNNLPLAGYDAAVFGDNHHGFLTKVQTDRRYKPCNVMNCGTFMRRTIAERDYLPRVGVLYNTGKIAAHHLDCSKDKFITDATGRVGKALRLGRDDQVRLDAFLDSVASVAESDVMFREALRDWVRNCNEGKLVQDVLSDLLKESRKK